MPPTPALGPEGAEDVELPSIGSAEHSLGTCKRCNFYPKGRCQNGYDCEFCHYDHEKRKRKNKKSKKKTATEELAKWHEDRDASTKKRIATNRADQKASEASISEALKPGANPWERVVELIDTNAQATDDCRDTSRMRSLLIQLKSNPIAVA